MLMLFSDLFSEASETFCYQSVFIFYYSSNAHSYFFECMILFLRNVDLTTDKIRKIMCYLENKKNMKKKRNMIVPAGCLRSRTSD